MMTDTNINLETTAPTADDMAVLRDARRAGLRCAMRCASGTGATIAAAGDFADFIAAGGNAELHLREIMLDHALHNGSYGTAKDAVDAATEFLKFAVGGR